MLVVSPCQVSHTLVDKDTQPNFESMVTVMSTPFVIEFLLLELLPLE